MLTSGYVHASAMKSLALLGVGKANVRKLARDRAGRLDLDALAAELEAARPAIVIANAGEVNAGDFDPIDEMADLAERHGAWLHVDGAFGLFARVKPRTAHLTTGVERANSVSCDGHKWLNVPTTAASPSCARPTGTATAMPRPPTTCRRSTTRDRRSATARPRAPPPCPRPGRAGPTSRGAPRPDFERLAEVPLNIVCFRWRPPDVPEERLDELNRDLEGLLLADGRVFARHDPVRGQGGLPAGDRQLADPDGRR